MRIAQCIIAAGCLLLATLAWAQQQAAPSRTVRELTATLNQFMRDASSNNATGFDRFFADDVIYTGSNGMVHTKADIMRSVNAPRPAAAPAEKQIYSAENIAVHDFGDTAIVAFRLLARTEHAGGKVEISNYRDTGTFLRRNGRWQVIAWQATKIPEKTAPKCH
jgi:ketosteroid isomerase-like protein